MWRGRTQAERDSLTELKQNLEFGEANVTNERAGISEEEAAQRKNTRTLPQVTPVLDK